MKTHKNNKARKHQGKVRWKIRMTVSSKMPKSYLDAEYILRVQKIKRCAVRKKCFRWDMKNELGDVKTHYKPLVASAKDRSREV